MNPKIDRQGVRTPSGLEQKYNFTKKFDDAMKSVQDLDTRMNQTEIFNRLTNNGKAQGVYIGDDSNLYINASYLVTGILRSRDGETFYLDLDNGVLKGQFTELSISGKTMNEVATEALDSQTQEEAFNKLTNSGEAQGIFYRDGELYINASYIVGSAPSNFLQSVYPVGAIYISTTSTNPATLFGFGKWEQIQDRFLLAAGSTYPAGTTGGEATHTLTVDEMPSHTHDVGLEEKKLASGTGYSRILSGGSSSSETSAVGGGVAHNNMPPYLAVYVWKRVS